MSVSIITKTIINEKLLDMLYKNIQTQSYKNIIEWVLPSTCKTVFENISIIYSDDYTPNSDIIIYMNTDIYYGNTFIENCVETNCGELYINELYLYNTFTNMIYKIFNLQNNIICKIRNKTTKKILHNELLIKFLYSETSEYMNYINNKLNCIKIDNRIIDIIFYEKNILQSYIVTTNKSDKINNQEFDIIYYLGEYGVNWHPQETTLGGSEKAVVNLTTCWAEQGLKIGVFGKFDENFEYNGVEYYNHNEFKNIKNIKNLIVWRHVGIQSLLNKKINFNFKNVIIDFHDNSFTITKISNDILQIILNNVNLINFKSEYHKNCYIEYFKENKIEVDKSKFNVIMNGIEIDKHSINPYPNIQRQLNRFCYTSSYDRGLINILVELWPKIKEKIKDAELHVYYGMDYIYDTKFKNTVQYLLGSKGVMDHGRCDIDTIIKEKYLSNFHLYTTDSIAEIDCISIRESLITGCIPLISNTNVFSERDGVHLDIKNNDDIIKTIVNIYENEKLQSELRKKFAASKTIVSWEYIGNQWIKIFI